MIWTEVNEVIGLLRQGDEVMTKAGTFVEVMQNEDDQRFMVLESVNGMTQIISKRDTKEEALMMALWRIQEIEAGRY